MKGDVTDTIIVLGIGVIVMITVGAAFIGLNQVNLPRDQKQVVEGGFIEVSSQLASLADSCWIKARKGNYPNQKNCFNVKVYSNDTVYLSNISEKLRKLPSTKIGVENGPVPSGESRLQITYYPVKQTVNLSLVSVCRPSSGDTCYSSSCSCQTSCMPGFDPDGDGTAETDAKGCVKSYSFDPAKKPCNSLSCSDPGIYRSGMYNGKTLIIDLQNSLGLLNATLIEYPSLTSREKVKISSSNLVSPKKVVGYGNPDRVLFRDRASFNTSTLDSNQKYGLFIWGCNYEGGKIENCRWMKPYLIK
ncbi:MAG: hypothetical protein ABEJ93_03045 [Candidatus Nanohalobium sp.]